MTDHRMHRLAVVAFLAALAPMGPSAATASDLDWWSLRPIERPAVPPVPEGSPDAGRARTPVDAFVLAKQREHGLRLAPEADRRTLIRRLYFDLVGLPPDPEEIEAFVADPDPDACDRLVEELLASPHYGERWARHWLDVAHYADTHGYDKDKPRPNAWPYRDYVIRSFNEDKPWSRFVREQLAGDVLWPGTRDGITATGFIAAGPWDFIGHAEVPEEKYDGMVARHLDRDDMVATTMNAFCSLTAQCAQCHDHKRDPVDMEDYYRLQAVFAALDRADRPFDEDPATGRRRAELAAAAETLAAEAARVEAAIDSRRTPELVALEEAIAAFDREPGSGDSERPPAFGFHSQVAPASDVAKWVQVDLGRPVPIDEVVLTGADEYGWADFGFPHRFRVEAAADAAFHEPVVLADHAREDFPRPGGRPVVIDGRGVEARFVRVTASRLWSRRQHGQPETNDWIFALGELSVVSGGDLAPVAEVTSLDSIEAPPRWARAALVDGVFGRIHLGGGGTDGEEARRSVAEQLLAWAGRNAAERAAMTERRDALLLELVGPELLAERGRIAARRAEVEAARDALPAPRMVYAGTVHHGSGTFIGRGHVGGAPRPIHVLDRGDVRQPTELVGPGAPGFIPGIPPAFELSEADPEGARRTALAAWIVHPENPLTWRSVVNRVWQYHFGAGLVTTPNDFGRLGELPSHPEMLDWLAVEFRDGGQSLKALHRLICRSAVYRQASGHREEAAEIDGSNRFLWRMNRRKLEAEAVRDAVLAVSGKLDRRMGGPAFQDFVIEKPEHSPHYQYHLHDPDDPESLRRSVYRFIVRSQPQPFMTALDCADSSQSVPRRDETLTALQALALLNNRFMIRMAEHFAARLEAGHPADVAAQVDRGFRLAIGRAPSRDEQSALAELARSHGLPVACRAILNLNEFAFVD